MINKWETYMPIALHRTYDRLYRQPHTLTAATLETLDFESLFTKVCVHVGSTRTCTCSCASARASG